MGLEPTTTDRNKKQKSLWRSFICQDPFGEKALYLLSYEEDDLD